MPHLALLSATLLRVSLRECRRLIVAIPPRMGKTTFLGQYFASWYLGNRPEHRVMLATYAAELAERFGRLARDTLTYYGPDVFGVHVRQDVSAAYRWDLLEHAGGMFSTGVGGGLLGHGADVLIVDDPFRDFAEAQSKARRDDVWEWWQATARTRLEPNAVAIVAQARLHDDDLAGRLLRQQDPAEPWELLELPAIARVREEWAEVKWSRDVGEALWPTRFTADELAKTERAVGPHVWAAQYQQRPQSDAGGIFQRQTFRYYRREGAVYRLSLNGDAPRVYDASLDGGPPPLRGPFAPQFPSTPRLWRFITVDLAASMKTTADYFAASVWGVTAQGDLLWLDLHHAHLEGPDQVPLLQALWGQWRPAFILIEQNAYQLALVQQAQRSQMVVQGVRTDRDKVARALAAATLMSAGKVWFPEYASWLGAAQDELLAFGPGAAHDDIVDTLSMAVQGIVRAGPGLSQEDLRRIYGW